MKVRDYSDLQADGFFALLCDAPQNIPVSFSYGGRSYNGFRDESFVLKSKELQKSGDKENCKVIWKKDVLEITLLITHYYSHGVTEWTLWFENVSDINSNIIEDVKTELVFKGKYPVLKGILGDHVNKYRPYSIDLANGIYEFSSHSGRATHVNFPYFDLEYGDRGVMLAIGWAGTWKARFASEGDTTVYSASSVNGMRLYLKPGEKIRTALFVEAPYKVRNEAYATNYWRSWYIEHNLPKADAEGNALKPFSTAILAYDTGLPNSDGSISERHTTWKKSMEKMISEKVKTDFRWFDAGWYMRPDGGSEETDWWGTVGTWTLDPVKWPGKSFRESTDYARENGMKTLVWFEPERVTDPQSLAKNFGYDPEWGIAIDGVKAISNNIGNPECFKWTCDRVCSMLRENRVEMYREDNNCNARVLWDHMDKSEGEGRDGITECKLIDGHYRLWDEIISCTLSYGGCGFVDSCASGGGRNDLESMRRGVPLLRSDADRTSTSLRLSMTTSFNKWIPFSGSTSKEKLRQLDPVGVSDKYVWRASYLAAQNVEAQYVQDPETDFDMMRFGLNEWKRISEYILSEMYVLTPWHSETDKNGYTAYCYFDPKKDEGVMLAFRMESCAQSRLEFALPFVGDGEEYYLTDEDSGEEISLCGGRGALEFGSPRSARVLWIKRK